MTQHIHTIDLHDMETTLAGTAWRHLTQREREVLRLLCQRLTDPEIAARLCIGTRTVESHVASIRGKLHVANRREAATAASRLGLI
jgi:DNA-binding CsgD family transcriptional regulator